MATDYEPVEGMAIQRDDGSVYFIPAADLEVFRLPDADAVRMREALGQPEEVTGYDFVGGDYQAGMGSAQAMFGPLAERPVGQESLLGGIGGVESRTKKG